MGCCNTISLRDELLEALESYLDALSIQPNEKDRIKDEIAQKINSSIEIDENKLLKFNSEEKFTYIEDKKRQIKSELDSYITIYDKFQEKKIAVELNTREKSIISELETKVKSTISKYKISDFKKILIESTWKKSWCERIHKDVAIINAMTIESREKYVSAEKYNSQKYLDSLYSIATNKHNNI
jgi:hypothetical protein